MKNSEPKSNIAVSVKNVSKQFSIPHEKISSIKIAFINLFKRKTYESFYALKDVSFEVKKGEFFGILGRNGSGKSTLLKILAGVYTADSGHTKAHGLISPFLELGIGFNPELSGRDNIYLNATVLGLTEKEIDEKFDSIVAFSELERFIDQKVKNYSSGMNVRLAFSVAIHANREILLMDEVLAVGDSNFQSKCLREFAKYKEQGKTVILVTHDIGTVQRYCDRAMLLRNGEVAMIGSAEEVGNEYIYQNMSDEEKRIIDEKNKKSSVLVLGCGRSGTSLLTSMIIKNYEFIGKNPMLIVNETNPRGFFEDIDVNTLNDKILEESGVDLPVKNLSIGYKAGWISKSNKSITWKASGESLEKIRGLTLNKTFCFKDPRFSYTFPIWRNIVNKNTKYVVVFRHPSKTAIGMIKQESAKIVGLSFEDALEVWFEMYSNILKYVDKNFLFIHYEDLINKKIDRLGSFLEIEVDISVVDINLNRSNLSAVDKKYINLYLELCRLANFDGKQI